MSSLDEQGVALASGDDSDGLAEQVLVLLDHWKVVVLGALGAGAVAVAVTFAVPPIYTARTSFLPPQNQSAAASAIASLGALSSLAGAATGVRNPIEQYVSFSQSLTVVDRIIDRFELLKVYEEDLRTDARKELYRNLRVAAGKKDGIIALEVDDESPERAARMANAFVEELRRLASQLVLSEAQQRRTFFEAQLEQSRTRLADAQRRLQASGFSQGALRSEPRAAADGYARLQAQITMAEVRLQTLRRQLTDDAPEIQQSLASLSAMRAQLAKLEGESSAPEGDDYVGAYRNYKYQETLYEMFSRQYELARLDESREGAQVQVIDAATPPEKRSSPKRALTGIVTSFVAGLLLAAGVLVRHAWLQADPAGSGLLSRLRSRARGTGR